MARLDDLRTLREVTLARMGDCSSDQNYAILGRLLLDTLKQIDELGGGESAPTAFWPGLGIHDAFLEVVRAIARWFGARDPLLPLC